jgi:hypothetical protein
MVVIQDVFRGNDCISRVFIDQKRLVVHKEGKWHVAHLCAHHHQTVGSQQCCSKRYRLDVNNVNKEGWVIRDTYIRAAIGKA